MDNRMLKETIESYNSLVLLKGIVLLLLGLFIIVWPMITLSAIFLNLGIFILIIGVIEIVAGFSNLFQGWKGLSAILLGLIGIILGIFVLTYPGISLVTYIYIFAIWFIVSGLVYIFSPEDESSKFTSILFGILSIIVGFMLFYRPLTVGFALFWILGIYSLVSGIILISSYIFIRSRIGKFEGK